MEALLHFSCLQGSIKAKEAQHAAHSDSELYCPNNFAKQLCKKHYDHPFVSFFKENVCLFCVIFLIFCIYSV